MKLLSARSVLSLALLVYADKPVIIPAVHDWTPSKSGSFALNYSNSRIVYDAALLDVAELLKFDLASRSPAFLPTINAATQKPKTNDIYLKVETDETQLAKYGEEGYKIVVDDILTLTAGSSIGYRRGSMSVLQLAAAESIPRGTIFDKPTSSKRWMTLDCARHFFRYEYIRDLIKILAFFKMNGLILHGADAEAFRFPVLKHPDLPTRGGSYTKAQILDLVQVGEKYGVEIIPGFEFPGHSTAFNLAFGTGLPSDCAGALYVWVTADWVVDVTESRALELVEEVLADALRWFPSKYVHLGVDDVPDLSVNCSIVKAYLEEHPEFGSYGDIVVDRVRKLSDWMKVTFDKETIMFNGLEGLLKKAEIPKDAIVQFWDQRDGETHLAEYLKGKYKLLISYPQNLFGLIPNAYDYIFPNLEALMEKGVRAALPADAEVEGYVFNIWCDHMLWLEDAYIEQHAALPRAMIASMAWNNDVSQYADVTKFQRAVKAVGSPPGETRDSRTDHGRTDKLVEVHHYSFEDETYEASVIKSCPDHLCIFIKDNIGSLHGSTYVADPPTSSNSLVPGKFGRALAFNDFWFKEGVSFGGADMPAPWTWSAWIRLEEASSLMPLFWSPQGALMLGTSDKRYIGLTRFTNRTEMQHFSTNETFPADRSFHHLVYTAMPGEDGETGHVDIYLDGFDLGTLSLDLDLPMATIMGYLPLDAASATQTLITIDEVRILRGYASQKEIDALMAAPPDKSFNNPSKSKPAASDKFNGYLSISTMTILFMTLK